MSPCLGHFNEFEHLVADLAGLDEYFDVGLKYEIEDLISNYSGPYLTLHMSIKQIDPPRDLEPTRYHMPREEWQDITKPTETDQHRLLQRSIPLLIQHLRSIPPS